MNPPPDIVNLADGIIPLIDRPIETVLVTNDDGVSSPFFKPTLEALKSCGHFKKVIFVAPAEEQSWIGTAVTRFKPVYAEPISLDGADGFVVSGTPSDCVYLGLNNLFPQPPDLVVSGINLGTNTGRAFTASSGTISAAAASFFGGCRSVAVSAKVPPIVFEEWGRHDLKCLNQHRSTWNSVAQAAARLIIKLIEIKIWNYSDVPALDLPWHVSPQTCIRVTTPAPTYYGQIFDSVGPGRYLHRFKGLQIGDPLGRPVRSAANSHFSDIEVINQEEIAINPLSFGFFGSPHLGSPGEILSSLRTLLGQ